MPAIDMTAVAHPALSIKLIGLFVTALVGLYTIEDLWEKFGDLRMTVVSSTSTTLRCSSTLAHTVCLANTTVALGRTSGMSYHPAHPRLHGVLQAAFLSLEPFRSRRRANELSFPGQPRRK